MAPLRAAMAAYKTWKTWVSGGVTVVDASDEGSGTEYWEAPIEVEYDIGDGTDPAVIANVLHAIEVNETQLSPALQTMVG